MNEHSSSPASENTQRGTGVSPVQLHDRETGSKTAAGISLRIEGMTCGSCVARVESALAATPGVESARVNLATETATVSLADAISPEALVQAVRAVGYDAVPTATGRAADIPVERRQEQRLREHRQALVTAVGIGLPIMALHWWAPALSSRSPGAHFWPGMLQALLTLMLLASPAGGPILAGGLRAVVHRAPNMDLLIAVGVLAAAFSSTIFLFIPYNMHVNYFHDAAMILGFINLGRYFEARARMRAAASLSALTRRIPRRAIRIENGRPFEVGIDRIRVGDTLSVAAESYVPVDGLVISGEAGIDQSMWTGEPIPIDVRRGDRVLGGSYVQSGAIRIEAAAVGADSAMARIVRLVEEAQASKTRLQRVADRVAGVFVPLVLLLAVMTGLGWLLIEGWAAASTAFSAMIAVLVVACPCAMGLATPTAVLVVTGSAALRGIIVRDAAALERAGNARYVLLDKTGTLTTGKPRVRQVITTTSIADVSGPPTAASAGADILSASSDRALLQLAASAEQFSPHPLAKAIVEYARAQRIDLVDPSAYEAHAGAGVIARIADRNVLVGNNRFLSEKGVTIVEQAADGPIVGTRVHVAADGRHLGTLILDDALRPGAAEAVIELKKRGLVPVLVTGDARPAAEAVAAAVGIEIVEAQISPGGKKQLVERYQGLQSPDSTTAQDLPVESGSSSPPARQAVIMVGDGINDAPALAAADVSIALGGGTEVAAQTASITLVHDRIAEIPAAIDLARRSSRIIRQNLFWAFAYNAAALPLAALAILPAHYAAAAMMCSSISVVLNSLRLQKQRPMASV